MQAELINLWTGNMQGKIAVITGAGSGIGKAIAELFADHGAMVVVTDVNAAAAEETAQRISGKGGAALALALDVSDRVQCEQAAGEIAKRGAAAILVNNAGVTGRAALDDSDAHAVWERCMSINATGSFNMISVLAGQLKETKGAVINISSSAALVTTNVRSPYCSSKAAVIGMTRSLAVELGPFGVRVNAICPGYVVTPINAHIRENEKGLASLMTRVPLGVAGEPIDVAEAAAFLASDRARFITGSVLSVDGGLAVT